MLNFSEEEFKKLEQELRLASVDKARETRIKAYKMVSEMIGGMIYPIAAVNIIHREIGAPIADLEKAFASMKNIADDYFHAAHFAIEKMKQEAAHEKR